MLIKIVLIALILVILGYLLLNNTNQKVRAWNKIFFFIFLLFSILAVIHPDFTNQIAHFLGVGRGADLLLYGLTVSFIFVTIIIYIKFKAMEDKITSLARKIAILESKEKEQR
jgi:hypothetical protein